MPDAGHRGMGPMNHAHDAPPGAKPTKERILEALVEVILEGGLPGFSVQEVADRAGVSHRTVYRHFPTRESLLEGLVDAVDARMAAQGGVAELNDLDELPSAVLVNFELFSRDGRAAEAAVRFGVGAAIETADRAVRTKMVAARVSEVIGDRDARDALMAAAMLRQLMSSRVWLGLVEAGLDADGAARAASWAAAVLVDALRAGRTPSREPLGETDETGAART